MVDVYVADAHPFYVVFVDGEKFDEIESSRYISWSEQWDIAEGYKEALTGYEGPRG